MTNTALVTGGGEANLLNDTATDIASVVSTADLSVTDSASPNPVAAGSNITYTQVVTNNGPSAADNATFVTVNSSEHDDDWVLDARRVELCCAHRRHRQRGLQ